MSYGMAPLMFDIDKVVLMDIDVLIDKGKRFSLVSSDEVEDESEIDDLEEYLKG